MLAASTATAPGPALSVVRGVRPQWTDEQHRDCRTLSSAAHVDNDSQRRLAVGADDANVERHREQHRLVGAGAVVGGLLLLL
jgi:hypothetical protein